MNQTISINGQIVTEDDIGRLIVTMRDHRHIFKQRWDLATSSNTDLDGTGTQSITVRSGEQAGSEDSDDNVLRVVFHYMPKTTESAPQYEEELYKDRRKDYEPSRYVGLRNFFVKSIYYGKGWSDALADELLAHTRLLREAEASLKVWVDQRWGMRCVCSRILCRNINDFSPEKLKSLVAADCSISDFKSRLVCKCGARVANVFVIDPSVPQPVVR